MLPEVQKTHFNYELNQNSPIMGDLERVVKRDENGAEVIAFEEVNYPLMLKTRPTVEYYSLEAMLKAGVNPNVPIHTGLNSRLEGADDAQVMAETILNAFEDTEPINTEPIKTE